MAETGCKDQEYKIREQCSKMAERMSRRSGHNNKAKEHSKTTDRMQAVQKDMFTEKEKPRASTDREKQRQIRKARASLLERFRPPVPETLLPKDPRPNYRPQYLQATPAHNARFGCTTCNFRYDSERLLRLHCESRHDGRPSDRRRRDDGKSKESPEGRTPAGNSSAKKCPHCDSVLAYAYNLSKHIEVRKQSPFHQKNSFKDCDQISDELT